MEGTEQVEDAVSLNICAKVDERDIPWEMMPKPIFLKNHKKLDSIKELLETYQNNM